MHTVSYLKDNQLIPELDIDEKIFKHSNDQHIFTSPFQNRKKIEK